MTLVYKADPVRGARWAHYFAEKAPDIEFRQWPDTGDPAKVRYLAVWEPPENIEERFPNLEILFSVAAGIDKINAREVPSHVPIVRMVEPGIKDSMVEYVTHAVLCVQRDFYAYEEAQAQRRWLRMPVRAASELRVGVLGLGELARAVLSRLIQFGYPCAAWSRSVHHVPGIESYAGAAALDAFLRRTDVLICLLPLTTDTRGILNESLLSRLPVGASLIQTGRGEHLDQEALVRLLDSGHLKSARLDVTDPEPLPADHVLWRHPAVRITPHIASSTRPETAVMAVIENIRRHHAGEPMIGTINRHAGY